MGGEKYFMPKGASPATTAAMTAAAYPLLEAPGFEDGSIQAASAAPCPPPVSSGCPVSTLPVGRFDPVELQICP